MKKNCYRNGCDDEDLVYIGKALRLEGLKDTLIKFIVLRDHPLLSVRIDVRTIIKETYETIRKSNSYRKS